MLNAGVYSTAVNVNGSMSKRSAMTEEVPSSIQETRSPERGVPLCAYGSENKKDPLCGEMTLMSQVSLNLHISSQHKAPEGHQRNTSI